jgi:hypothetical protein
MSRDLNVRALSGTPSDPDFKLYVFKVGKTANNCADRWKGLVQDRKPIGAVGHVVFEEPRYAGVGDWKILKCWDVPEDRHDDRRFKPWLAQSGLRDHVRHLVKYRTAESDGISPEKGFIDLFVMSESYARSTLPALVNDPLHEELLASVARAVVLLVDGYAAFLDGSVLNSGRG